MELYQLRSFVAVAEEGNLTRAAERLFLSQPAISAHIKALEDEMGVRLFERTSQGMLISAAGEILLEEAETVLSSARQLVARAAQMRSTVSGNFRIGINNEPDFLQMDVILASLLKRHQHLSFSFNQLTSTSVLRLLTSRDIDVGFIEGEVTAGISGVELARLEMCIVAPAALASQLDSANWALLQEFPWVFKSEECSYYRLMNTVFRQHGIQPQNRIESDWDSNLSLVRKGLGMTVAERSIADHYASLGEVYIWPYFSALLPLHVVALRSRADEPAVCAFFDAAKAAWLEARGRASQTIPRNVLMRSSQN